MKKVLGNPCNKRYSFSFLKLLLLALIAFSGPVFAQVELYDPIAVYLTWQRSPESTMTVQWITHSDRKKDTVEYQQVGENEWRKAKGSHQDLPGPYDYVVHCVELTELEPATDYRFRTGSDAVAYKFRTMPADPGAAITFVVGGDMYHDTLDLLENTNRAAAKTDPMFALVGGDICYAGDRMGIMSESVQSWTDWMLGRLTFMAERRKRWIEWLAAWKSQMVTSDGRLIPMVPTIGNHDVNGRFNKTPKDAEYFYMLFAMPGKRGYNVLDFGNYMSIFILDSDHTHPINGKQARWLKESLEDRWHIAHKFALYHVPAYPSVRKFEYKYSARIRKYWVPLFEQYGLTAAFEHHDHDYKRTFPISNGAIDPHGVLYLGDGAWGVEAPRKRKATKPLPWYIAKIAPERHFIHVTIKGNTRRFTAISPDGYVIDETTSNR